MKKDGDDDYKKARNKALKWLSYRERSTKELRDYLDGKGFGYEVTHRVIEDLQDDKLIDDRRFAAQWIDYSYRRGRGSIRIKFELKEKGIDDDTVNELTEEALSHREEYEKACMITEKYLSADYEPGDKRLLRRTVSYLKRRGYPERVIYRVINDFFYN